MGVRLLSIQRGPRREWVGKGNGLSSKKTGHPGEGRGGRTASEEGGVRLGRVGVDEIKRQSRGTNARPSVAIDRMVGVRRGARAGPSPAHPRRLGQRRKRVRTSARVFRSGGGGPGRGAGVGKVSRPPAPLCRRHREFMFLHHSIALGGSAPHAEASVGQPAAGGHGNAVLSRDAGDAGANAPCGRHQHLHRSGAAADQQAMRAGAQGGGGEAGLAHGARRL